MKNIKAFLLTFFIFGVIGLIIIHPLWVMLSIIAISAGITIALGAAYLLTLCMLGLVTIMAVILLWCLLFQTIKDKL